MENLKNSFEGQAIQIELHSLGMLVIQPNQ
jgi:hypothetical protein